MATKAEEERSVVETGEAGGIEQEQAFPKTPKHKPMRNSSSRMRRPLQPIEKENMITMIPYPNQPPPPPPPPPPICKMKKLPTKQGQGGDCFQSKNKPISSTNNNNNNNNNDNIQGKTSCDDDESSDEKRRRRRAVEVVQVSLGEELSAARKRVERLRMEREKTEEELNERDRWLDGQMKAMLERGEVQKLLELQVDCLYRLNQLHHHHHLHSSSCSPHYSNSTTPVVQSLRDNHHMHRQPPHLQPPHTTTTTTSSNVHHHHHHDLLVVPSSLSSSSSSSTAPSSPLPHSPFSWSYHPPIPVL